MKVVWLAQSIGLAVWELARAFLTRPLKRLLALLPALLLVSIVLALISSSGVLAPFVYPLF